MKVEPRVEVVEDPEALAEQGARHFVELARHCIDTVGRFSVALSGGSTPRGMYRRLAAPPSVEEVDWRRVHVFWGDERCVPPDDEQSNYRMAHEEFLVHVGVPPDQIHRIRGEIEPERAAAEYEVVLERFYRSAAGPHGSDGIPGLDLVLLGLGDDAHTASLFPGTRALKDAMEGHETRSVVANFVPALSAWRVTMTRRAINTARQVTFLVSGAAKARALSRVLGRTMGGPDEVAPASLVQPVSGQLLWLVDRAAIDREAGQ